MPPHCQPGPASRSGGVCISHFSGGADIPVQFRRSDLQTLARPPQAPAELQCPCYVTAHNGHESDLLHSRGPHIPPGPLEAFYRAPGAFAGHSKPSPHPLFQSKQPCPPVFRSGSLQLPAAALLRYKPGPGGIGRVPQACSNGSATVLPR